MLHNFSPTYGILTKCIVQCLAQEESSNIEIETKMHVVLESVF